MRSLKHIITAATVAALTLSNAAMADTLAPGKPASVKQAQMMDNTVLLGIGLAAVAIGVTIAVTSGNGANGSSSSTSTSTTS
jgi:hypothetical protein